MVPWPIALLTLYYGVVAASSAAMVWKIADGASQQPLAWALLWCALSTGAMFGLPLLREWGRRLAVWTSTALLLTTLAGAGLLVHAGRAGAGLLVTLSSAFHLLAIRYLRRPIVKTYFASDAEWSTKPH